MLLVNRAARCCLAGLFSLLVAPATAQDTHEFVIELGPVDLPAHAAHAAAPQPAPLSTVVPVDGWMQGFRIDMIDAHGAAVPMQMLHHLKVMAPARRELFMPIMLRLVGAGEETRAARVPPRLGYRILPGDSLLATAMVHNPTDTDYHGVRFRVVIEYRPADAEGPAPTQAYPFYAHVTAPDDYSAYDLPPGRSERSREVRPAIAGRILGVGGHLHRYGAGLRLENATTGEVLWEATPEKDADGHVLSIPRKVFLAEGGLPISPEYTYRLTATYDNPTGETIPQGAMGTLGGLFLPDPGVAWPAIDPADPLYRADLMREMNGGMHHGAAEKGKHQDHSEHEGHH